MVKKGLTYEVNRPTPGYDTAADAKQGENVRVSILAGNYYIHSLKDGMINLTNTKGMPGMWIDPQQKIIST